ncbi:hypothetical protein CEXT_128231 [Caerostris extrusa]|uniref:Uncharacterized protein n=1 Tax=Caerostris extrusa TaxID=172846 RepID=A0AAV4P9K8_CAEEX|nr:hypothetical protein CEXT_128231 [Caerostris extrusa]
MKSLKFALNTAFAVSFWIWCLYQSILHKNYSDIIVLIPYVVVIQFVFKKLTFEKKITFKRSQQTESDTVECTKMETSDKFTSTDNLKNFLPTKDANQLVLTNVNEPMENLNEYGLQNTNPFIPVPNWISYLNNDLQLSTKASIALTVTKHEEFYNADSEEGDTPRKKRFIIYSKIYNVKNIRSKWQKFKRQTRVKYERLQ